MGLGDLTNHWKLKILELHLKIFRQYNEYVYNSDKYAKFFFSDKNSLRVEAFSTKFGKNSKIQRLDLTFI